MRLGYAIYIFITSITLNTISAHCIRFSIAWLFVRETNSASAFAIIYGISSFIDVFAKPILAPIADYFNKIKVVYTCRGFSIILIVTLLLQVKLLPLSIIHFSIIILLSSFNSALSGPASSGIIPSLVNDDKITEAQSLLTTIVTASSLSGAMVAVFFLSIGGVLGSIIAAMILSIFSFLCMLIVKSNKKHKSVYISKRKFIKSWHLNIYDGMRVVLLTRSERTVAIACCISNAALYPFFFIALPLWISKDLKSAPAMMASVEFFFGLGIVLGGFITKFSNAKIGKYLVLIIGKIMLGLGLFIACFINSSSMILISFLVSGIGFSMFNINASTLRASATPQRYRVRMIAGVAFLSSCLNPVSTQFYGVFIDKFSATQAVGLSGFIILVSALILTLSLDLRKLLKLKDSESSEIYSTFYPHVYESTEYSKN